MGLEAQMSKNKKNKKKNKKKKSKSDKFSYWENLSQKAKGKFMKQSKDDSLNENFPSWKTAEGYGEGYSEEHKLDPKFVEKYPPLATLEELAALDKIYENNPVLRVDASYFEGDGLESGFNEDEPWIQTYSGRRFNPINPNYKAIVIQDIAHSLSNICRFTGHCLGFYSVAQHSVLVSYMCDKTDALYGLLHDGSEAFCQDISSPIKRQPEFESYRKVEAKLQIAICKRFGLPEKEPPNVKSADMTLLATEARDLLPSLRPDWNLAVKPLPFKIVPLQPKEAKKLFLDRFRELISQRDTLPGPIKEIKADKGYWVPRPTKDIRG